MSAWKIEGWNKKQASKQSTYQFDCFPFRVFLGWNFFCSMFIWVCILKEKKSPHENSCIFSWVYFSLICTVFPNVHISAFMFGLHNCISTFREMWITKNKQCWGLQTHCRRTNLASWQAVFKMKTEHLLTLPNLMPTAVRYGDNQIFPKLECSTPFGAWLHCRFILVSALTYCISNQFIVKWNI